LTGINRKLSVIVKEANTYLTAVKLRPSFTSPQNGLLAQPLKCQLASHHVNALWRVLRGTAVGCVYFLNLPDDVDVLRNAVTDRTGHIQMYAPIQNPFKNCP
jgi:hypothetical protein